MKEQEKGTDAPKQANRMKHSPPNERGQDRTFVAEAQPADFHRGRGKDGPDFIQQVEQEGHNHVCAQDQDHLHTNALHM